MKKIMHMRKYLLIVLGVFAFHTISFTQEIKVYDAFKYLEPRLKTQSDTTYIVNFWATWCKPCVDEMPAFTKAIDYFSSKKVKFIMVSMDFPTQLDSRLVPFVIEKGIKAEVILLDDPSANTWIDKVSSKWSGSIPATLIFNKTNRHFHEGPFTYDELKNVIETKFLTP